MSLDLGIKILPPMRPIWTFSGLSIHIIKQTLYADLCYVLSRSMYLFHVLFCALLQIQILRCLQHGSQFRLKWLYQSFHGGQTPPIPSLFSESDGKVQTTNLINYWTNAIASPSKMTNHRIGCLRFYLTLIFSGNNVSLVNWRPFN